MSTVSQSRTTNTYFSLVRTLPLVPIRNHTHLRAAQKMIDSLLQRADLDHGEEEYLEVLGNIVAEYENEHFPIAAPSDASLLRHLIEDAKGVSQADVARDTGIAPSTISEILSGTRAISKSHIPALAQYFNVSPALFLASSTPASPTKPQTSPRPKITMGKRVKVAAKLRHKFQSRLLH